MCGIAGILVKHEAEANAPIGEALRKMTASLVHRGPDDEGYLELPSIALGMRRLSIIDLETGQQPISNEDQSLWVIQNGEIYNHIELRQELEGLGHVFKTHSDTEVIVHAYEEYGTDFVHRLNGMFAIAIWDTRQQALLLYRDRLGIKPLYYYEDDHYLIFASEIQAIRNCGLPSLKLELDFQGVNQYLIFGYIPAPHSIIKNIKKLLPGHYLSQKGSEFQQSCYWDVSYSEEITNFEEAAEHLSHLIEDAVQLRLRSDVPVGAFLSGGIDSTLITSYISKLTKNENFQTFSIGYSDEKADESRYAELIAKSLRVKHTTLPLDDVPPSEFLSLMRAFGEPFSDSSAIPSYYISKLARDQVTVVLTGDGGDELFLGYDYHAYAAGYERVQQWQRLKSYFPPLGLLESHRKFSKFRSFAHYFCSEYPKTPLHFRQACIPAKLRSVEVEGLAALLDHKQSWDPMSLISYMDLKYYHPNDILSKVDSMSMRASLEARPPLLDYRIVEFAAKLATPLKFDQIQKKRILVHLLEHQLIRDPKLMEVLKRPKHGFNFPYREYLGNQLKNEVHESLSNPHFLQSFNIPPAFMDNVIQQFQAQALGTRLVWVLFCLGNWFQEWKPYLK